MADPQVQANDEQEIAEAQNSLVDLLYDVVAQAATTRFGGFVYRRLDGALSTVEKTAKWSLPQPSPTADGDGAGGADGKISAPPLLRPLPWILFLPALVVMRMVRVGLSLVALLVGQPQVTPSSMVYYVQNKRRKLRALKYRGQKLIRISRAEAKAEDELETTWLSRIIMPLRTIVCRPGRVVVTPHRHHHRHPQRAQNQQQQQQQQQGQHQPGRKRNARDVDEEDDSMDDGGTVSELLDKYADDASDSSYHAESGSGESSDSSISEQEKSAVDEGASKSAEPAKKESNGHAHKEGSQARRKSDLNVDSDSKPTASKPAENGSVDGGKKDAAKEAPASGQSEKAEEKEEQPKPTENGPTDGSKTKDATKEERPKQESNKPKSNPSASESERTDSKQTSAAAAAGQKNQQPEEDASKNQSMSDVKANYQQKQNKQQQQQQPNQPNQPQLANANGGSGGKKQKRPSQGHQ